MEIGPDIAVCLGGRQPAKLGVAVSGGSDSTALLLLLSRWAATTGTALRVATVDHGLRPDSAAEARAVAAEAARLDIAHDTLEWTDPESEGNLQDAARRARYRLLGDWARGHGIDHVALGHTMDDQAETVLMRLERGSGVDGLAGMTPRVRRDGIAWLRPLLGYRRDTLRSFLTAEGVSWAEDPSNDNARFARIRLRRAIGVLGLSVEGLAETAARHALARAELERSTREAALRIAQVTGAGSISIQREGLAGVSDEIRLRLFAHAIRWITGSRYRPRLSALTRSLAAALDGRRATLAGSVVDGRRKADILICREFRAVEGQTCPAPGLWDGRWQVEGSDGAEVRALGEKGLAACENWRKTGLRSEELKSSPALWRGSELISAPLAGRAGPGRIRLRHPADHFFDTIITH